MPPAPDSLLVLGERDREWRPLAPEPAWSLRRQSELDGHANTNEIVVTGVLSS
jgi:hypothetical protein